MKLTILLIQLLFCLAAKYRTLLPSDDLEDMSVSNSSQDVNLALMNGTLEDTMRGTSIKDIAGVGKVLQKQTDDSTWVLLMKLSKNDFCFGSRRWTDGQAFNANKMLDTSIPKHKEYDAKSLAFHKLKVDAVKLQTNTINFEEAPEVHFKYKETAEKLITTNDVEITAEGRFNSGAYWGRWSKAFSHSRNRAPAFMRASEFVRSPKPQCRLNPEAKPSGCGKKCVFCMQAGDGHGCPAKSARNDISKGIGLNAHFCGGGDKNDCSSSGSWAGDRSTLLWGRIKKVKLYKTYRLDTVGDVLVRESDEGSWALVMKLSKNDFCHGSPRWTDGKAFKAEKLFDITIPKHREYDAKSLAFHKMHTDEIMVQTNRQKFGEALKVKFMQKGTPEKLMTTNEVKISAEHGFNTKGFWTKWEKAFGSARDRAPAFMRANKFVREPFGPNPQCRKNPQSKPSGCGRNCVFCMQAGDGQGCPVNGAHNDVGIGLGLSAAHCNGGNRDDCSSSGNWVGDSRVLVWAKWSCKKHEQGQCAGRLYSGECGELEADDCDTHYVRIKDSKGRSQAYMQCSTAKNGQCVTTGPACYGTCLLD